MSVEFETSLRELGQIVRHLCRFCRSPIAGSHSTKKCLTCAQAVYRSSFKAHRLVKKAIDDGALMPITWYMKCVDCGAPAECHEHRDYNQPLAVEPVCRPCDQKRGPGIPMVEIWQPERADLVVGLEPAAEPPCRAALDNLRDSGRDR